MPHTGPSENPDTLSLADGDEPVNGLHPELDALPDGGAGKGVDIATADTVGGPPLKGAFPVDGLPQGVDDPAPEELPHLQGELPTGVANEVPGGDAVHIGIGHKEDVVIFEAHHLSRHLATGVAVVNAADVTHRRPSAGGLNGHTHDIFNFPREAIGFCFIDLTGHLLKCCWHGCSPGSFPVLDSPRNRGLVVII